MIHDHSPQNSLKTLLFCPFQAYTVNVEAVSSAWRFVRSRLVYPLCMFCISGRATKMLAVFINLTVKSHIACLCLGMQFISVYARVRYRSLSQAP